MIEREEKEDANVRDFNVGLLNAIRAIVYEASPILTLNLTLANLKKDNTDDFVFNDFSLIMGNSFVLLMMMLF